ncbi:MAG: aminotransferase class I/II-fold pyridoxal phosphate-dependent enzyme [Lachnospiraceae bacterium]|nr:aminotransferase class I/II-fold pyridoxal phosphate-dependent enzyme [Lachnospiraceae bacterium]
MRKDILSDKIVNIAPSGIRKFFDIVSEMPEAISLGVGEPDFDTPWKIREEAIYSLERGRTFYTSNAGLTELRQAVCEYAAQQYDLHYNTKECVITIGGSEAIDIAFRSILNPGDEVIVVQPCFVSYAPCVILAGGTPVYLNLTIDTEFKLTVEALETVVTDKTKAVIMCFPNNPTGAIMTKEELEPIADFIKEKDLLVLTDEIYSELTYGSKHYSIAAFPDMKERSIVVSGFSKTFAMTGWRLGYALAPREIMRQMVKIHQFAIMAAPTISQYAAIQALTQCDDEVDEMREAYNQRRRYLLKAFDRMGLDCFEAKGAFYMFPSIKEFGLTSDEFAMKLLEEEELAVVPGSAFGECGEGYIRISYAYSIQELKEALSRMERFIMRLREKR